MYSYNVCIFVEYSDDSNIKKAYSLALRRGQAKLKDLQIQVVGAENTGKTCLISSFLDEDFVEGQAATNGVDVEVCKIHSRNWAKSSESDKVHYLQDVFFNSHRGNALKYMIMEKAVKPELKSSDVASLDFHIMKNEASLNSPLTKNKTVCTEGVGACPANQFVDDQQKGNTQGVGKIQAPMQYDLIAVFWDFAGQVIFHNSHSVFISDNGVIMITFNASLELTDRVVSRQISRQPPECHTVISSIHYWLQVVDSLCSVEENVLLVGTHIDKIHSDINEACIIAKETILPQLCEELKDKPYAKRLAGFREGFWFRHTNLEYAVEKSCFFVSNKCRDEEIYLLKAAAIKVATALQEKQQIYFLKIEQALMQHKEPVISKSMMLELIKKSTFMLSENSPEFEGTLRYFHNKRTVLHFSRVESLKDIVILSPRWLAKLLGYVIGADSFKIGHDSHINKAWERLCNYGILDEILLQHMLEKFHSDYPAVVQVTKQQVVDILLCFHLLARIPRDAWFIEEGFSSPPDHGDSFIVPCLVPREDDKTFKRIPATKQERIIYFKFSNGFVPFNLLNQLIADCICYNVKRNNRLLW